VPRLPDEVTSWTDRRPLALLLVLALLVKIPTLGTAAFWDEMAWLGQAGWLANAGLLKVVPGLRPDAQFFGHAPGLHLAAAVLFKAFRRSIEDEGGGALRGAVAGIRGIRHRAEGGVVHRPDGSLGN